MDRNSKETRLVVAVVDDDDSVRESLPDLLWELGYASTAYATAEEFLESREFERADCILLDIGLPKMTGPMLYRELVGLGLQVPVIFITGLAKKGIPEGLLPNDSECLLKPFSENVLKVALDAAMLRI